MTWMAVAIGGALGSVARHEGSYSLAFWNVAAQVVFCLLGVAAGFRAGSA